MRISIKYIAEKLGVSPALVSLVLNGKEKEGRVNSTTAEKIKKLAAELNYSPNRFAKGLKKGKSNILGLIVADISNPFYARLTRYIEDEAELFNYKIIIGSSDEKPEKMASLIDMMKSYQVDGFIIVPAENSLMQIEQLILENYSVVLLDRYFPSLNIDHILVNNRDTAFRGTAFLIQKGCKNIAAFTYKSKLLHFQDRIDGFKNALEKAGIPLNDQSVHFVKYDNIFEDVRKGLNTILEFNLGVDGIFFATDTLALNAFRVLKGMGINISERFRIFSFDENETFGFLNFPVPHSAQPLNEIGKKAVNIMVNRIENPQTHQTKELILKTEFFTK